MTVSLAQARSRRDAYLERLANPPPAPRKPPSPNDWRPTPTPAECDLIAAGSMPLGGVKLWDRSPIAPWAFDPTQPPLELPVDPPVCTVLGSTWNLPERAR
jgi:hypothetical protein